MKPVEDFAKRFKASVNLNKSLIVSKQDRYFLVNERLRGLIQEDFFYAGTYLGKVKHGIFFPGFILLAMLAEGKSNKIVVDDKTAWLFICGRDVFKRGVQNVLGSARKGDHALIVNRHNECLGFGRILHNIDEVRDKNKVVVKNISDIGDFLRREK
jgi:ribosome biogenesis protein Nip4